MKEMIYAGGKKVTVLVDDTYKYYHYIILSFDTCLQAYVKIPVSSYLYYKEIYNIDCHYGLTYNGEILTTEDGKEYPGWFISWDYYCPEPQCIMTPNKQLTIQEVIGEVKDVIDQLIIWWD